MKVLKLNFKPKKAKDYRKIKNPKLLQLVKLECIKEKEHLPESYVSDECSTKFAIDEININQIYIYVPFINKLNSCLPAGELILQIEVENIKQKEDIFNFCLTKNDLKFHLTNIISNFPEKFENGKRYLSLHSYSIFLEIAEFELKYNDIIYSCILPGKPIDNIYFIVERKYQDEIERTLFSFKHHILPKIIQPPKKSIFSFFTNLFFTSKKNTINRNGVQYNKLDHLKLD